MSQLSNFVQNANPITLTAGENIAQGDLVSVYGNGKAYYATSTSTGSTSLDPVSGYLRPFFVNSAAGNSFSSFGFTGYPYYTYVSNIVYYSIKAVTLSNGNVAIFWYDQNTGYFTFCILTGSGATVVGNTTVFAPGTNQGPLDICAIPNGGFAVAYAANGTYYYVRTYTNSGTQVLSVQRNPSFATGVGAVKIAPIGTSGFLIAAGQDYYPYYGEVIPLSNSGTFGTNVTGIQIYATNNGTNSNSNSDLMVLSNGNFGLVSGGNTNQTYYPYWYIFSATTSAATTLYSGTTNYTGGYSTNINAAPDSAGGFFVYQTAQNNVSGYNYLYNISATGSAIGTPALNGFGAYQSNAAFAVIGSTVYVGLSGYNQQQIGFASYSWNGSSFTNIANTAYSTSNNPSNVFLYFVNSSTGVNCLIITPSGFTFSPSAGSVTINANAWYEFTFGANLSLGSASSVSLLANVSNGHGFAAPLGTLFYPDGNSTSSSMLVQCSGANNGGYVLSYNPTETILPIGVATQAATANNPVTVQTGGNVTTRLTFTTSGVNANRNVPAGNNVNLFGNTAEMFGIVSNARPIN